MNHATFSAALLCCVFGGCTTANRMAFDQEAKSIDFRTTAVVLMTIDVSGSDDRFVPELFAVQIERINAQKKHDRHDFKLNKDADAFADNGRTLYLARMALAPGDYELTAIGGTVGAFPNNRLFSVPLLLQLAVKPGIVSYLGRVTARLRPRNGAEFRAGPLFPLRGQAAAGISTGTWDVSVDDRAGSDFSLFRSTYRVVAGAPITKSLLPQFDRAAVQRWWDSTAATAEARSVGASPAYTESSAAAGVRR